MVELVFSVLNRDVRIVTDEPIPARKAVRIVLGVDDVREGEVGAGGLHPPVLLLVRDYARARRHLPGVELNRKVILDAIEIEMDERAAVWLVRLPDSVRLKLRNILYGVAAYVRWCLMRAEIYTLHASGLKGGVGALAFAGESDSGKTTLVIKFLRERWEFLADDNLPLSLEGDGLKAHYLGEAIYGMRFGARELDSFVERGYRLFGYPGYLTAPAVDGAAAVKAIFILERGGEVRFEEMEPAAASTKLLNLCKVPLLGKDDYERYFDFAVRSAAATRCVRLRFSPERAGGEIVKAVVDYIECLK
ncbi:MAG: hypothetical protein ABIH66_03935 [bacterium]